MTRSRFSVRVPVLSKQTVSTRPSASSTRALRTTAPRRDSRRAAACWATVATSGSPSGTAATAIATPEATDSRSGRPHSTPSSGDHPAAGEGERQDGAGELGQPGLHAGRRGGASGGPCGAAGLGGLPDGDDDGPPATGDDRGAVEEHAGAVGDLGAGRRGQRLGHRQRLAGEPGLVDLQVLDLEQPGVRGDDVAGLDEDDVPEPDRRRGHLLGGAVGLAAHALSCSSSRLSSTVSARSRCRPLTSALMTVTLPTRIASVASPRTAVAAAPVARTGVSGSASSAVTVRANRAGPCTTGWARTVRTTAAARLVRCSLTAGRSASRRRTSSGSSACQGVCTVGAGTGRRAVRTAVQAPVVIVVAVAYLPGVVAFRWP